MLKFVVVVATILLLTGCASSYVTPGGPVDLGNVENNIMKEILDRKPTANFPSNIAFTRIQQSGYNSYSNQGYGSGRFSVITNRDITSEDDLKRISQLDEISNLVPLSKILIPQNISGLEDIRIAAAKLHADILMVYTFDTDFTVGPKRFQTSDLISLGFFNNKIVRVQTTASAAFYDVKTGFLYGVAEATEEKSKVSDLWGSITIVDAMRIDTEKLAFNSLLPEIEKTWLGIAREYKNRSNT